MTKEVISFHTSSGCPVNRHENRARLFMNRTATTICCFGIALFTTGALALKFNAQFQGAVSITVALLTVAVGIIEQFLEDDHG